MKTIKKLPILLSILSFLTIFTPANAEIKVVASIKPIHSLASYLMDGVGKPDLIVDGYASPHGFALKPSHAKMIQNADIIFWVGEDIESFLEKPLKTIAKKAEKIELMEIKGLTKLKFRERNIFEGHDDHGHKEDDHDDHAKKEDDHDDHDHDKKEKEHGHDEHDHDKKGHKKDDHDDHGHEGHAHGEFDPHIWLDPMNAKIILSEMAEHLIENDQKNEAKYKANLNNAVNDEIRRDIEKLKSELWYQHFNSPTAGKTASYSTEDIKYIRYCRDVLNTFYELPSWRNRVWTPGSNKNSYSGQKRNKIFSGANVRIERKISSKRPFKNIGNDVSFDKSIAEITYNVTSNNKTTQWTSIQLSSEAHSWCPPYSR